MKEGHMKEKGSIKGIIPVAITPFQKDGSFDYQASLDHLENLINDGVETICILGATSEYLSINLDEHMAYVDAIVPKMMDRVNLVIGVTRERTEEVITLIKHIEQYDVSGVMILPPYYCHPSQDEIYEHFRYINDHIKTQMIVYNNPGSAGVTIEDETFDKILALSHARVVKESTEDMALSTRLLVNHPSMTLLCGVDNLVVNFYRIGAAGWISMAANIAPKMCLALASSIENGSDYISKYKELIPLLDLLESVSYPVQAIKYMLAKKGVNSGYVRRPRQELTLDQKNYIDSVIDINDFN